MLEVKFKSHVNGLLEKIGDCGDVDAAIIQETAPRQLEEPGESEVISISEERDCNKRDEAVPEEATLTKKTLHSKGTLRYLTTYKFQRISPGQVAQLQTPRL